MTGSPHGNSVLKMMTVAGTGCIGRVSSLPLFEPTDGGDLESEPESPAPTVFINTRVCTRLQSRVRLRICSPRVSVKLWRRRGRQRKRLTAFGSYVLLTICSLSPFLKVRSDAVRDS